MIQKAAFEKIIGINIEEVMFVVKIINLAIEISTKKTIGILIFEIDGGSIHTKMALMNQDIIVLLQIVTQESEIWYLGIVVFLLVCWLLDIVIKDKYP